MYKQSNPFVVHLMHFGLCKSHLVFATAHCLQAFLRGGAGVLLRGLFLGLGVEVALLEGGSEGILWVEVAAVLYGYAR